MKYLLIILLALIVIAATIPFPSARSDPSTKSEPKPEEKQELSTGDYVFLSVSFIIMVLAILGFIRNHFVGKYRIKICNKAIKMIDEYKSSLNGIGPKTQELIKKSMYDEARKYVNKKTGGMRKFAALMKKISNDEKKVGYYTMFFKFWKPISSFYKFSPEIIQLMKGRKN